MCRCLTRLELHLKLLLQLGQRKGLGVNVVVSEEIGAALKPLMTLGTLLGLLSPVWVIWRRIRWDLVLKLMPQPRQEIVRIWSLYGQLQKNPSHHLKSALPQ